MEKKKIYIFTRLQLNTVRELMCIKVINGSDFEFIMAH